MNIGFNLAAASDVIKKIADEYNALGGYTSDQWLPVKSALRSEWVGPDELSFEEQFVKKLCTLYTAAYNVAATAGRNVALTAVAWVDFQHKNLLEGASSGLSFETGGATLENLKGIADGDPFGLKYEANIITFEKDANIDASTNRGLQNEDSAGKIQGAVVTFVDGVKEKVNSVFNSIDLQNAFFGVNQGALKSYLEAAGIALSEVMTAVQDLYDTLAELAGGSYSSVSGEITSALNSAEASVLETGSSVASRWNS